MKIKSIFLGLLITLVFGTTVAYSQGWLHPGIDIKPLTADVSSNLVYTTHAGFVTYAGPAPEWVKEKGWLVQVETDFNRDNSPDVITRYTHLYPWALMVNDVHYRREIFDPIKVYQKYGRSLPYGNGPYVTRNQLIGIVGDSGSPGRTHIQYEIVTSRFGSLFGVGLNTDPLSRPGHCLDDPYVEQCSDDPVRPGLFFAINRKKPDVVRAPGYVNPGIVTPQPGRNPRVFPVFPAPAPELPEPPLPAPDFIPDPPPITDVPTPTPAPPLDITPIPGPDCESVEGTSFGVNMLPIGNGLCEWYITIWPPGSIGDINITGNIGGVGINAWFPGGMDCSVDSAGSCPYGWIGSSQGAIDGSGVYQAQGCPPDYWERCGYKYYPGQGPAGIPGPVPCGGETNLVLVSNRGNIVCSP